MSIPARPAGPVRILAIESSCDEAAAAVVEDGHRVLSDVVASQIDIHRAYGGVVPEVASRAHLEAMVPAVDRALATAGVTAAQVDAISVTAGPVLAGALLGAVGSYIGVRRYGRL